MGQPPTFSVCLSVSVQSLTGGRDERPVPWEDASERGRGGAGGGWRADRCPPVLAREGGGCISDSVQLCEREEAHWGPPGEGAQQRRLPSPHGRLGAGHGRRLTPSRRG